MTAWPASLPHLPLVSGYNETLPNTVLRTQMDIGPAKTRRRSTSGVSKLNYEIRLTLNEGVILEDFFLNDCAGGALSFTNAHPRTGDTETFRFLEPPQFSPIAAHLWQAKLSLEKII